MGQGRSHYMLCRTWSGGTSTYYFTFLNIKRHLTISHISLSVWCSLIAFNGTVGSGMFSKSHSLFVDLHLLHEKIFLYNCIGTIATKNAFRRAFCIKEPILCYLFECAERVPRCDCLNEGMMELPIKEERDTEGERGQTHNTAAAQHNRPFFQLAPQHSSQLSPSHYSPAVPPAPSQSLPFQYGGGEEWGSKGGRGGWKWIVGKHIHNLKHEKLGILWKSHKRWQGFCLFT